MHVDGCLYGQQETPGQPCGDMDSSSKAFSCSRSSNDTSGDMRRSPLTCLRCYFVNAEPGVTEAVLFWWGGGYSALVGNARIVGLG